MRGSDVGYGCSRTRSTAPLIDACTLKRGADWARTCYPRTHYYYGSYTLNGTGTGTGTMMGTIENNGSLSLCSVYSTQCNIETHHFMVSVPVPFLCSVNEPLEPERPINVTELMLNAVVTLKLVRS